jgi:hypothetical protein
VIQQSSQYLYVFEIPNSIIKILSDQLLLAPSFIAKSSMKGESTSNPPHYHALYRMDQLPLGYQFWIFSFQIDLIKHLISLSEFHQPQFALSSPQFNYRVYVKQVSLVYFFSQSLFTFLFSLQ